MPTCKSSISRTSNARDGVSEGNVINTGVNSDIVGEVRAQEEIRTTSTLSDEKGDLIDFRAGLCLESTGICPRMLRLCKIP